MTISQTMDVPVLMNEMLTLSFNTKDVIKERIESDMKISVPTFTVLPESHPALKEVLKPFDFSNPPINPNAFASALVETCKLYKGLGLSANQCGFKHRVFVIGSGDEYVAFFNPEIVTTKGSVKFTEGCLSFPNLYVNIERPEAVEVKWQDFNGEPHKAIFNGLSARCFLHELDHLNGITFDTKLKPLALKMAKDRRIKLNKQLKKKTKK